MDAGSTAPAGAMDASSADFRSIAASPRSPAPGGDDDSAAPSCLQRVLERLHLRQAVEDGPRTAHVHVGEEARYGDNLISTSKYSLISFIPRSLFEQFRRIANVYFLGISVLMLIGEYLPKIFETPLSAYSTLGPLCLVLAITMIKEGLEDWTRHSSDNEVNNRMVAVLQEDGSEKKVTWKELRVGHVIRVDNKGEVPADVLLLQTSEPRSICYIETSNIDGETNLKLKDGLAVTGNAYPHLTDVARIKGEVVYEPPNASIHTFTGKFKLEGSGNVFVPAGARNVVLRGCTLRNTKWIAGLVLYTGRDTKVMKKSGGARSKMSQVEKTMNTCIQVIFAAQFVLCTIATIALALWNASYSANYPYLMLSSSSMWIPDWLGNWFTFLILFNNFIPISLYVTVELVNYAQAWLLDHDAAMYDPTSNTPAKARTSNLNQDLGQIEYVFSDKTGTLTRNVMEFKQCSVAGRIFGTFAAEADTDDEDHKRELAEHARQEVAARANVRSGVLTGWLGVLSGGHHSRGVAMNSWRGTSPRATSRNPSSTATAPVREVSSLELPGSSALASGAHGSPLSAQARDRASSPVSALPNPMKNTVGTGTVPSPTSAAAPGGTAPGGSGFDDPVLLSVLRHSSAVPGYGAGWNADVGGRAAQHASPSHNGAAVSGGVTAPLAVAAVAAGLDADSIATLEAFFMCMAVCHTVVPEADEAGGPLLYQAESPDEAALTKAARELGFEFMQRQSDHIVVRRLNGAHSVDLTFRILGVHEFNSTRKRMAVIVKAPDGRYLLMCKGADNVIFERAVPDAGRALLDTHLTKFASDGLRTLVLAQREMSADEYAAWRREYDDAAVSLEGRDSKLAAVAEKYEQQLCVLGSTAIEDRLQDGVPGTIQDLARAGIKTWVLTGDKVETAINIGFSCRLLDPTMELLQIVTEDEATLVAQIDALYRRFAPMMDTPRSFLQRVMSPAAASTPGGTRGAVMSTRPVSSSLTNMVKVAGPAGGAIPNGTVAAGVSTLARNGIVAPPAVSTHGSLQVAPSPIRTPSASVRGGPPGPTPKLEANIALVVTGISLNFILGKKGEGDVNSPLAKKFLTIARCCKAVIASRVSPAQKAQIVKLVRRGISPSPMTLAIGDGANDVGMIQRAEVGVGISGKEGLQAVNSADFAIAQFRFLRRLLLVHGRWDYRRMTKVVLYSFYKNVVITLSLFYYTSLTGFSGTSFYESLVYSTYNFVLGLPIIFIGILDRDVSDRTALDHPAVYNVGLYFQDLNVVKMLQWIARAVLHSVIVFWIPYGTYSAANGTWTTRGLSDGLDVAGLLTFSALIYGMQTKVAMETLTWTWLNPLMLAISMVGFYIFIFIYESLFSVSPQFYGVATATLSRGVYWLTMLLIVGIMCLVDFTLHLLRTEFMPRASDIAMELDRGYGEPGARGFVEWGDETITAPIVQPSQVQPQTVAVPPISVASSPASSVGGPYAMHESPDNRALHASRFAVSNAAGDAAVVAPAAMGASRKVPADVMAPHAHAAGAGALEESRGSSFRSIAGTIPHSGHAASGTVLLPHQAVLDGATTEELQRMGMQDASRHSSYDFAAVSKPGGVSPDRVASPSTPNWADGKVDSHP